MSGRLRYSRGNVFFWFLVGLFGFWCVSRDDSIEMEYESIVPWRKDEKMSKLRETRLENLDDDEDDGWICMCIFVVSIWHFDRIM